MFSLKSSGTCGDQAYRLLQPLGNPSPAVFRGPTRQRPKSIAILFQPNPQAPDLGFLYFPVLFAFYSGGSHGSATSAASSTAWR